MKDFLIDLKFKMNFLRNILPSIKDKEQNQNKINHDIYWTCLSFLDLKNRATLKIGIETPLNNSFINIENLHGFFNKRCMFMLQPFGGTHWMAYINGFCFFLFWFLFLSSTKFVKMLYNKKKRKTCFFLNHKIQKEDSYCIACYLYKFCPIKVSEKFSEAAVLIFYF